MSPGIDPKMKLDVLLSDTAREDFDRLDGGSPERMRVEALLERIAAGAVGEDRVLSASGFELRYVSLETTYVFFRRDQVKGQATVVYFCEMDVQPAAAPEPPRPYRVIDFDARDIPRGMEVQMAVEFTREDGARSLVRHYARKIDMGDSYVVFHHIARGASPAVTMIVNGKKGRVEGDFRHDEIELVTLLPDGTVQRYPPNTAPVWIKNPFEGAGLDRTAAYARESGDQAMERVMEWMKTPEAQERREAARKWFQLG